MKLEVEFEQKSDYLMVRVCGEYDPAALHEVFLSINDMAKQIGLNRILIDSLALGPPASDLQRFNVGVDFAEQLPVPFRVAVLYPQQFINKFFENTAVNRGALVHVCSESAEALQWLLMGLSDTTVQNAPT